MLLWEHGPFKDAVCTASQRVLCFHGCVHSQSACTVFSGGQPLFFLNGVTDQTLGCGDFTICL